MKIESDSLEAYIAQLPTDRQDAVRRLRDVIRENLPAGFQEEYPRYVQAKLDMGKGCIRFKKPDQIPYDLIAQLCRKITVDDFLKQFKNRNAE